MESFESVELIPGLPAELSLECLTRLPHTAHRLASAVCSQWRRLFLSPDFYDHRKKWGHTRKVACLVQSLIPSSSSAAAAGEQKADAPAPAASTGGGAFPAYGIAVFDPVSRSWERLPPVPKYPGGLPLFAQLCGSQGKLVLMGGWDPQTYEPVPDVFVYDFAAARWRRGKDMPSRRSFFAAASGGDGTVYVAGGHDEGKNALSSAWAYGAGRDEWTELTPMSQERDECEGVIVGGEFWVVSGYATERQGAFEGSVEAYDPRTGEWGRVDCAWREGKCPRSCVGVGKNGGLVHWGESDSAVRVGTCGVAVANRLLVSGSEYEGAPQGFFLVESGGGQNGKMERVDVPGEFSGFVQSGCCVEI